jgi:4-hydroxy-3-methylbut-2-en-1-yl diphosphate synthase IspG/GcpE
MTQRNPIAPVQGVNARVAELHQLCDEDYAKGQYQRAMAVNLAPSYAAISVAAYGPVPEPTSLDTATRVAQRMLDTYGDSSRDGFDYAEAYGAQREALRLLLRALGVKTPKVVVPTCPSCGRTFEDCTCTRIQPGGGQ